MKLIKLLLLSIIIQQDLSGYPCQVSVLMRDFQEKVILIHDKHQFIDLPNNYEQNFSTVLLALDQASTTNTNLLWELRNDDHLSALFSQKPPYKPLYKLGFINSVGYFFSKQKLKTLKFVDIDTNRSENLIQAAFPNELSSQMALYKPANIFTDFIKNIINGKTSIESQIKKIKNKSDLLTMTLKWNLFKKVLQQLYNNDLPKINHPTLNDLKKSGISFIDYLCPDIKQKGLDLDIVDFEILSQLLREDRNIIYSGNAHCLNVRSCLKNLGFKEVFSHSESSFLSIDKLVEALKYLI